jgi:AraC-like DNA-binding protein
MYKIYKITSSHIVDFAAEELKKYLRMMMPRAGEIDIEYKPDAKDGFRLGVMADFGLDTSESDDITLDDIAKKVSYSRCYFSSIFKKCMGMSIWDYICIKRIEEALMLIKTSDKNIADIALECGFNNAVNFNKLFKKYTNVTPNFFRK